MAHIRTTGSICVLFCAAALLASPAYAAEVRLVEYINELRKQGYNILYSSDLVLGTMRFERQAETRPSLAELESALQSQGLTLRNEGELWVVTLGEVTGRSSDGDQAVSTAELENIIVTGSLHSFPEAAGAASARRFAAEDLAVVPSLASDIMRATLRLPGVSTVGVSAKPYIRGGLKDELLILQDGIELLEPFHLADYHSAYSTLDYHIIETVDFYTGGFPSRYGNRMSGVMDISNDWTSEEYRSNLGVSSFASFINTRQDLPGGLDGDWSASYRQGDLSDLTDYIQTRSGDPEYRDGSLRFNLNLGKQSRVNGGVVYSEDDIVFEDEEEAASSQIDSWYGWFRIDLQATDALYSSISLSYVDFQREKGQGSLEQEDKGGFLDFEQDVERLGLRNDYRWLRRGVVHEFGWQLEYSEADYDTLSRVDRGELADIIGTEREIERDIHLAPDGWSGGAYWAGEWTLGERWLLQPGLRWDWQDYYLERDVEHQVSPRLGLAYDASESVRLRLSVGRFFQPEGVQELQVVDGIERFFKPQRSDQVVAGLEWADGDWQLLTEVYYKRYDDTKGRFENIFNPFVLLPELEPDRVGLFPDEARAYGLDFELGYEIRPGLGLQLRYSYMKAEDKLEGDWIDRRWSQEHTANASLVWRKGDFSLAAAVLWHSGWRSTQLPEFVAEDEVLNVLDYLNNTELREHFSIDLSARYSWQMGRALVQVYADLSNVTSRNNQAGIDFDIDEEEAEGGFAITPDEETLLGYVPSVGITLSF